MKVTPQITADFEDYPELSTLFDAAIRRVVELMEIHDISELRRIRKTGVFGHPYDKDIITPLGARAVPNTVAAARYAVGETLLDYLETIGIHGVSLEMTNEERTAISALWDPSLRKVQEKQDSVDPQPVTESEQPQASVVKTETAGASKPETENTKKEN